MNTGDALRIAELALDAMRIIPRVPKLSDDQSAIVLAALRALGRAFGNAEAGTISIDDLEAEVDKLSSSIVVDVTARNRSIDDKLAAKFAKKDED